MICGKNKSSCETPFDEHNQLKVTHLEQPPHTHTHTHTHAYTHHQQENARALSRRALDLVSLSLYCIAFIAFSTECFTIRFKVLLLSGHTTATAVNHPCCSRRDVSSSRHPHLDCLGDSSPGAWKTAPAWSGTRSESSAPKWS